MPIHPTAIVQDGAKLGADVSVGPFSLIGPDVVIGDGCVIGERVSVVGRSTLGRKCRLYAGASVGADPQDLKFGGEDTEVIVGDRTVIREYATVNKGTAGGGGVTRIGSDCMLMAYTHVAHDCILEDRVLMANVATLAGHVLVERGAIISGLAAVHHFGTVGRQAFISGLAKCTRDAPPYMITDGNPARVRGVNIVGLQRSGVSREAIAALRQSCRLLYHSALSQEVAKERIVAEGLDQHAEVKYLLEFLARTEAGNLGRGREAIRKAHGPSEVAEHERAE
ncbi:MAG TPA: acyl-ACP--UDP-N-acetylglucosamine O-acyltransferase [Planctomycetota bacterium]|nr:acyl-ACP--UDP-N-acetylglucosamine O-acyltransferase [Planctomycetota bacterium]